MDSKIGPEPRSADNALTTRGELTLYPALATIETAGQRPSAKEGLSAKSLTTSRSVNALSTASGTRWRTGVLAATWMAAVGSRT
jgi:hypothetical protein